MPLTRGRSRLRICQIGTIDEGGGAAAVASGLMRGYRARGCRVWQVVGRKHGSDASVLVMPEDRRPFYRLLGYPAVQVRLRRLAGRYPNRGWGLAGRLFRYATHPGVLLDRWRGIEDFEFPGSYEVLDMLDTKPDVVHCHNLHGGYFDLRALEWLSRRVPTILALHDMWTFTGHCAHAVTCERWRTGCGACPDLHLDPAVHRDATAYNWERKRQIYGRSRLYVSTPSRWLFDRVQQSMLGSSLKGSCVIPNGVDLSIFHPADRRALRCELGWPIDARIVLLTTGSLGSMWKDDGTLLAAIDQIAAQTRTPPMFVAVGRESAVPRQSGVQAISIPYQTDPREMARYCQAADLYLHAARADTFPLAVLEALACGTPVVATEVGGIPEQIRPVDLRALQASLAGDIGDATGVLVPWRDPKQMATAVLALLGHDRARAQMGDNAARDARARFDLETQVDAHLAWYRTVIDDWRASPEESACAAQP